MKKNISFVCLLLFLTGALAITNGYAAENAESTRHQELAKLRLEVEHAKSALFEARKNLTERIEEQDTESSEQGLLGLMMMPAQAHGVRVVKILRDAAADEAGIRSGDLIVAINGRWLSDLMDRQAVLYEAYDALANISSGEQIEMTIRRGDRRFVTVVTADARKGKMYCYGDDGCRPIRHEPIVPFTGSAQAFDGPIAGLGMIVPQISADSDEAASVLPFMEHYGYLAGGLPGQLLNGLELAELNDGLGHYFGTTGGVLVINTSPNGLPGIKQGDVILACGGRIVNTPRQMMHMLMSFEQGDKVSMKIMRERQILEVTSQMPSLIATAGH